MSRRKRGGTATVSLHVREVAQLFNSFDPSPFWGWRRLAGIRVVMRPAPAPAAKPAA